jgi:hypothetical protein
MRDARRGVIRSEGAPLAAEVSPTLNRTPLGVRSSTDFNLECVTKGLLTEVCATSSS